MSARQKFSVPALVGLVVVAVAFAMGGAEPAQAIDPTPFLLGTGTATPNVSANVTALKGSGGVGIDIENVSPDGTAIFGVASAVSGASTGVYGKTNSKGAGSSGVSGILNTGLPGASSAGVSGASFSTSMIGEGPGVYGQHLSAIGTSPGVLGETSSTSAGATGVTGQFLSSPGPGSAAVRGSIASGRYGFGLWGTHNGSGYGVYGTTGLGTGVVGLHEGQNGAAAGVQGETNSVDLGAAGVLGRVAPTAAGPGSVGVRGINNGTGRYGVGVWGSHAGSGWGVYGQSPGGIGVAGESATGWAGYFFGNVYVSGALYKGAGGTMIDNPLNPSKQYLAQASVESPDMKTIYDGIATTDAKGFAVVKLPVYFQALNKDYRYQLTSLSGLQQIAVAKEISHNRFTIQSEKPNSRVSWQVTGIRHDAYANAHRIQPVQEKAAADQGKYLQPGLYGQPPSKTIDGRGQLYGAPTKYARAGAGR